MFRAQHRDSSRTIPRFLAPGDLMEVTIDGIGSLRNPVV
jgi:2-keto-4-pentenoate hydratase/2-oxohepta-3-ene-1,7-dioic acid hydratase in catechol pathway